MKLKCVFGHHEVGIVKIPNLYGKDFKLSCYNCNKTYKTYNLKEFKRRHQKVEVNEILHVLKNSKF